MYILIIAFRNGSCTYFGPFPTKERAEEYALACQCVVSYARHHVAKLAVPHNIVQAILWKENGNASIV